MATGGHGKKNRLYLGVDVGGTKILAALAEESGAIVARQRASTPRNGGPEQVLAALEHLIDQALAAERLRASDLTAMGVAVPGVVEPKKGRIIVTPNMSLSGVALGGHLERRYAVPVALGNDCNLGALGETWLGSARKARSVLGIFVGTGIGGGFVRKGRLWRGAREAAGEIGHIVMKTEGGARCGCGNYGCLETLASRTAIENQIREAVAAGRSTLLVELLQGNLEIIRSNVLRQALEAQDPLTCEIVRRAAEILGYACLTVRHLLDPELIVLGGGLVAACSGFIMPIVQNVVGSDQLPGAHEGGGVLLSALGDDAVVLGAVALARTAIGRSPFKKKYAIQPTYPQITHASFGEVTINGKTYTRDVFLTADGKLEKRKKKHAEDSEAGHLVSAKELEDVCQGGPEILFLGTGQSDSLRLSEEASRYLSHRSIDCFAAPTAEVAPAYNKSKKRKAALLHVTC
jgi:glucokinase